MIHDVQDCKTHDLTPDAPVTLTLGSATVQLSQGDEVLDLVIIPPVVAPTTDTVASFLAWAAQAKAWAETFAHLRPPDESMHEAALTCNRLHAVAEVLQAGQIGHPVPASCEGCGAQLDVFGQQRALQEKRAQCDACAGEHGGP